MLLYKCLFFSFNTTPPTKISPFCHTLSLHYSLPISVLWPTALLAQPFTPQERARVDRFVEAELAKSDVPSASVAVVRGGQIAFVKAYGLVRLAPADRKSTRLNSSH